MKLLVDDLFEYTTIQQTNYPLEITKSFDIAQLLQQVAIDFEMEAEQVGLSIQVKSEVGSVIMKPTRKI